MPTYRYECLSCRRIHEIFHSITEEPHSRCPSCGGDLSRLIGGGGAVLLRGAGFYTTDNRSGDYKKAAKTESESSRAPEGKKAETAKEGKEGKGEQTSPKKETKPERKKDEGRRRGSDKRRDAGSS